MNKAEKVCFENLELFENEIKTLLLQSNVINCDETGMRINGSRNWLHVASTGNMTCYFPHPKRGSKAMNDMGILPNYDGTIIHDFWSPYYKYSCMHALCNAHLLRELTGIYENYDQQWSKDMGDLLIEIKECVDEAPELSDSLEADQIKNFEEKYDYITKAGLEENPLPPISPTNKRLFAL